jgi:Zn-dependent protease with chaperone function
MIRPVPVTAAYRASVALAAAAMLAAPLLYAGFVAAVAFAVLFWAYLGLSFASHVLSLMIYLAVLAAGLTVLLFLGKAFFSWPKMEGNYKAIHLADHPALARLIARVCAETGAPEPAAVAVDMSLNGAASLIHPIRGLFTNQYRLVLGLPLVAISDQQHMAHLIAHEVGHFSQGGAMRVRQLIHWGQYYLSQLVDGRDKWDVWLASQSDGTAYIIRLFAWAAAMGIWLSRRVLALLLRGTLLINARMSREMEFHADLYAIRVAGSDAFAESVITFAGGNAAVQKALQICHRISADGRYPDDLAALTAAYFHRIPEADKQELARQSRYTIGLGYDSHPDDTDRLERSDREHDPGVLHETGEARDLFTNFPELCRTETLRFFEVEAKEIVPVALLIDEDQRRDAQDGARIDFFGAVYDGPVWLRIGDLEPVADAEWPAVIRAGDDARAATLPAFHEIVSGYGKLVVATVVLRRLDAGLPVDWMRVELEPCNVETARERMFIREREYWARVAAFHDAVLPVRQRLVAAWARRTRLPAARQTLFEELYNGLRAMEAADELTTQLALDLAVLGDLGASINEYLHSQSFMLNIQTEFEAAVRHAGQLEEALTPELLAFARPEPMDPNGGVYGYLNTYGGALVRMRDLRLRRMGQLAELALEVERCTT